MAVTENQFIANKVANIAFAGKVLMKRISVYKKRSRKMEKLMMEAYNKGGRKEAYPYAMGLLMLRNQISYIINTSKKINFFVDYTIYKLADNKPPQNLVDLLRKFDDSVKKRGVMSYRQHLEKFENSFDLNLGDDDSKYPELKTIKETKKKAMKELNRVLKKRQAKKREEQLLALNNHHQSQSIPVIPHQQSLANW